MRSRSRPRCRWTSRAIRPMIAPSDQHRRLRRTMGTTDHDAALAVIQSTSAPIHDIGTAIYLSPDVFGWAGEWGGSNPFSFYFAGRGGMLGDVGPDVVCSAFGWFEPGAVKAMYEEGVAVAGATSVALRMAEATDRWG